MELHTTSLTAEQVARRGDEDYDRKVRAQVEPGNQGKIVAIDVHTEEFDVGESAIEASDKLLARQPNAEIWFIRVGHRALHRIGRLEASEDDALVGESLKSNEAFQKLVAKSKTSARKPFATSRS